MAVQIELEKSVFQITKCVSGFIAVSDDSPEYSEEDDEQFAFVIEATTYLNNEEETYVIKWVDKKPKKRKLIENDIVMNYKLSNC